MSVRRVSPQEAHELIQNEGYVYIDVRSETEFAQGHPAHAFNIPLMRSGGAGMVPNVRFVEIVAHHFPKDAKIIVGCLMGGRSARAADALAQAGFSSVIDQRAGWGGSASEPGWGKQSLPASAAPDAGRSFAELEKALG